jgi:FkbM family methyltransferase
VVRRYIGVLRREEQPVRFLISRALMYSGLSKRIVIQKRGFRLRFYPTNASAQQWVDPYHDHDKEHGDREESFFRRYLRPGDVVVDVGANFGLTALAAFSAVGPTGEVHAFEPHPRIFEFLVGNIELNGAEAVVKAHNLALGERAGTVFLTDRRADDQNTVSLDATGISVPMSTLDDAVAALPHIDLLKIDVEGYEKLVLEGATETLARVDCVYFESCDANYSQYGYELGEVIDVLAANGLKVRRIDASGSTSRVSPNEDFAGPENLVALHDPEHLRLRLDGRPERAVIRDASLRGEGR